MRHFYRGLASLLRAGVVMGDAVSTLCRNDTLKDPPGAAIEHMVNSGLPLSKAMAECPDHFAMEDVALIEAGESSGSVEETLDRVAQLDDERRAATWDFLRSAWYPIGLLHAAALMLPFARRAMRGQLDAGSLKDTLLILAPFYAAFLIVLRMRRTATGRTRLRRIVDRVPGLGVAARARQRASLASVLEATYSAGIPIDRCVLLAGRAADLGGAEPAARSIAAGTGLTLALGEARVFPPAALARLDTGEQAGEISKVLRDIAQEESERARHLLEAAMSVIGKGIYLFVALWIAWSVIAIWSAYYGRYLDF